MTKSYIGRTPAVCDLCETPITNEFFDARMRDGRWANCCKACFGIYTSGKLGTGYGQHYAYNNGAWEKQV